MKECFTKHEINILASSVEKKSENSVLPLQEATEFGLGPSRKTCHCVTKSINITAIISETWKYSLNK